MSDKRSNSGGRGGGHFRRGGGGGGGYRDNRKEMAKGSTKPIVIMFQQYAEDLDYKHDKNERVVKLSRDITVESKRTIFLLHRIKNEEERLSVLGKAENKLADIRTKLWHRVAQELQNEECHQYLRAYTNGLQEYVEAFSFYHYIKTGELLSWQQVQNELTFTTNSDSDTTENLSVHVPQTDYVLGLADLTGEVMRQAINMAGCGDTTSCFKLRQFLQDLYNAFLPFGRDAHRELPKKTAVLQNSLRKVENVCYDINVRGTEVPKDMLSQYLTKISLDGRDHDRDLTMTIEPEQH